MLEIDPNKRLGNGENGWEDIKNHPYFDGVDWDEANNKKLTPPFIPKIDNENDTKYFENIFTDQPLSECDELFSNNEGNMEDNYKGFTYVSQSVKEMKTIVSNTSEDN